MNEKIVAGYDINGVVYDAGNSIIRKVNDNYFGDAKKIFDLYLKHDLAGNGIVKTTISEESKSFNHAKHVISYPFEWTANMYKDAVLFHLCLFVKLDEYGLALKDALPNNIVFDYCHPVFVDFLSLVEKESLKNEEWLVKAMKEKAPNGDLRFAVLEQMFIPFMMIPFIAFAQKNYGLARNLLWQKACNAAGGTPSFSDLGINPKDFVKLGFLKCLKKLFCKKRKHLKFDCQVKDLVKKLSEVNKSDFKTFCNQLVELVEKIDVTPDQSGYDSYYDAKAENFDFSNQEGWKNKQVAVADVLKKYRPETVLDIGANTGWFSFLALHHGAKVIAVEIDESSVDKLYSGAKSRNARILPLQISFTDFEREKFGEEFKDAAYRNRDFKSNPLFLSPVNRLQSDLVLCLALIHHLILGLGLSIEDVMRKLSSMTKKVLVLEYTGIDDPLVVGEPSFFKNISKFSKESYNLDLLVAEGKKYFSNVEIMDSHPDTRKILVFTK